MGLPSISHRLLVCLFLVFSWTHASHAAAGPNTVRIGVLAKRGLDHCRAKWDPTAVYLTKMVASHRFEIVPLDFASVPRAVADQDVDFILTNPSSYVELEDRYGVDGIATLVNRLHCGDRKVFGGVIFTRADHPGIHTLGDLHGKDFMAVKETSLGGWRMAWREMKMEGMDPQRAFKSISFGGTHDAVVCAVQNHKVDAGTVRTDTLERMAAEGSIDLAGFRVLNTRAMPGENPGFLCSTRLYPEWPMAKLNHTPMPLAEKVTHALFLMKSEDPAAVAAKCAGWTYPLSYRPVHDCLRDLQLGPYASSSRASLSAVYRQYKGWIVWGGMAFIAICFSAVCVAKLNAKLSTIISELKETQLNLESALAAANQANKAKDEFLANMSHELRTPMNGIIGMTGILQNTELTDEQKESVQIIVKSSEGLLRIINDILDYATIEAGKMKLDISGFDPFALIDEVVREVLPKANAKALAFTLVVDKTIPAFLKGDRRHLKQVIGNLMSNAVKFTHQGAVSLHAAMVKESKTDCILRFSVKDTGIGIAPERMAHIYDPFSQVDNSSTREFGGTGLGLALAKHFAVMMGGHMGVESTPGMGSHFWFTVRLEKQLHLPIRKPRHIMSACF